MVQKNMSDTEKKHEHHGGPNGFIMGALLGGALVYLVGTPKGRRILKEVSENGIEFLENIESIEDLANLHWDDLEEEDEYIVKERNRQASSSPSQSSTAASSSSKPASSGRRFFRGVKRK
jgi:hypothetical protein